MLSKENLVPLTDPIEIDKFEQLSKEWWDPKGKFKQVIGFNDARFKIMRDECISFFDRDSDSELPLQGLTVLDVGCGGGMLSEAFALAGAEVVGIDGSEMSIQIARTHANKHNPPLNVTYHHTLIESFPSQQTFDIVINAEVIEHVNHQADLVAKCCQLLKPNGLLIMATLNRTWLSFLVAIVGAEYVLKMLPKGTHDWKMFVKPEEIQAWLAPSQRQSYATKGISFIPVLNRWIRTQSAAVNYITFIR